MKKAIKKLPRKLKKQLKRVGFEDFSAYFSFKNEIYYVNYYFRYDIHTAYYFNPKEKYIQIGKFLFVHF